MKMTKIVTVLLLVSAITGLILYLKGYVKYIPYIVLFNVGYAFSPVIFEKNKELASYTFYVEFATMILSIILLQYKIFTLLLGLFTGTLTYIVAE